MTDDRLTKTISQWLPPVTRPIGRPTERWTIDIKRVAGATWHWIERRGEKEERPTSSSGYKRLEKKKSKKKTTKNVHLLLVRSL